MLSGLLISQPLHSDETRVGLAKIATQHGKAILRKVLFVRILLGQILVGREGNQKKKPTQDFRVRTRTLLQSVLTLTKQIQVHPWRCSCFKRVLSFDGANSGGNKSCIRNEKEDKAKSTHAQACCSWTNGQLRHSFTSFVNSASFLV